MYSSFRLERSGYAPIVTARKDQNLKERITQNFTEGDTGGTFRKNYMKKSVVLKSLNS